MSVPKELENSFDLEVAYLTVVCDDKPYTDQLEITTEDVMEALSHDKKVTTSQPTPEVFTNAYQSLIDKGCDQIVCLTISEKLSGTMQSAVIAKDLMSETDVEIEVINTKSAAMVGDILLSEYAYLLKEQTVFKDVVSTLRKKVDRIKTFLSVDDLKNLIRSGRLSKAQAIIGNLLRVKPLIKLKEDGSLDLASKVRSSKKVIQYFLDQISESVNVKDKILVSIGGIRAKDRMDELRNLILQKFENAKVVFSNDIPAVVATHIGIGGLGISWVKL